MEPIVAGFLSRLSFAEFQQSAKMAVLPLMAPDGAGGPDYLTLGAALEGRVLSVAEISQAGSVPQLKAVNTGELPVLLLDGEELAGAKQNRVLNTTILLKERSETVIPVSCTEQGRWAYSSAEFGDSGVVASPRLRVRKSSAVTASLGSRLGYSSDQAEVWDVIRNLSAESGVRSSTGALRDLFAGRAQELENQVRSLPCLPEQRGLFVFINGKPVGFEVLSRERAYAALHPKLVRSYALDALHEAEQAGELPDSGKAQEFLERAAACRENRYESVGHGWDCRFEGSDLVGSALVYCDTVIHAAFFRAAAADSSGGMAGFRRRTGFRMRSGPQEE